MFPDYNTHKKQKIVEQDLPPQDLIKSPKRKKLTTTPVQHLTPPKLQTNPVIAKTPLSETVFLSKFKQARSNLKKNLRRRKIPLHRGRKNQTPKK